MITLLTGITGTFGRAFLDSQLCNGSKTSAAAGIIRGYSRDEFKQSELHPHPQLRLLLGDIRDKDRLRRAMEGCEVVIHAAALKRVEAGEKAPDEFVKTNVLGTLNVIEACHDTGVEKAVLLSSDKAVHPANLYGATKLCAEKLWLAANAIPPTKFSVVRYGNVKGSRGSILEKETPVIRDDRATRFWMNVSEAVDLVLLALQEMQGGEVFVPKIGSARVAEMVYAKGEFPVRVNTGLLPGEKLHESLISTEEVPHTWDFANHYRVLPHHLGDGPGYLARHPQPFASNGCSPMRVPPDFTYTSEVSQDAP